MNTIRIFPNGEVEVGTGEPGYRWVPSYSQKLDDGCVSMQMTLRDWRAIAKRDGAKLIQFKTEAEAATPDDGHVDAGEEATRPPYDC